MIKKRGGIVEVPQKKRKYTQKPTKTVRRKPGAFALPEYRCLKCNHTWIPRTNNPDECPNCHSRKWVKV